MSGNPAFQGNAFQGSAFQSGAILVAASYSLGALSFARPALSVKYSLTANAYSLQSPDFATPSRTVHALSVNPYSIALLGWPLTPPSLHFNYHFSVAAYGLGSPSFATPPVSVLSNVITVYSYSLSSPVFSAPLAQQAHAIHVSAYAVASPDFGSVTIGQNYHLSVNAWAVGSPVFGAVLVTNNYQFSAAAYSLSLEFLPPNAPITVDYTLHADAYWLQSPWPNRPRLSCEVVDLGLPPTYYTQAEDAANLLRNLLNLILTSIPSEQSKERDELRRLVGILRDNAENAVRGTTLGTDLQNIYLAADDAGATFRGIDEARKYLMSQVASKSALTQIIFRNALIMTLGEQSKIITRMPFATQDQIKNMMVYMAAAFDNAKAIGIDEVDVLVYQTLNAMGAALMNHLGTTELQLPRMLSYSTAIPMPSLYLANRIYADPSRADEIAAQNSVVHPAFMPMTIRVRSNVEL
jgi:hypothetical protein